MALYTGRMLVRRGNEADYDPDKLMPGEWALSTDKKIIRICVAPGIGIRMATYDAFEEDMAKIEEILENCQSIEEAIEKIYNDVKNITVDIEKAGEYAQTATEKADEALQSANSALNSMNIADEKANIAIEKANEAFISSSTASEKAEEANKDALSADNSAQKANTSETNAKDSENNAYYYSKLSKSYAVGDTGERLGEDIDNAKYYSEQSKSEADRAKEEADRAQNIVGEDYVTKEQIKEYSLIKNTGYELTLSIDTSTYIMTIGLNNSLGEVLSTKSIDFPIESMVVNADYENGKITLTLQNGNTVDVDVSALVSGLVKDTFTIAGIDMKDNISAMELKIALELDKVENVNINEQIPSFVQAEEKTNLISGDTVSILFGKIMKWFAELKTVAFSGSYEDLNDKLTIPTPINNLLATTAGTALDAVQGRVLNERLNNFVEIIRGTLTAGETEITIDNERITENSILSFYTSIYGVNPVTAVATVGSITLTFDAQETDMEVGVRIDG